MSPKSGKAILLGAVCAIACLTPARAFAAAYQTRSRPAGARETTASLRGVALTAAQVRAIDRYVRAEMAREKIPGVQVGIYSEGRILLARGYGLANVETNVPIQPYSMMKAGSVGKQFTAAAIMMLVEQGKVRLSDSVLDYFPELPAAWKPITIANLLSHTSGIFDYFRRSNYRHMSSIASDDLFDLRTDMSEAALLAKVAQLPLEFPVGTRWAYSNTNYLLLGILIHRLSGQSRIDYTRQHIFTPAGMATARGLSNSDIIPNRASGYMLMGGVLKNKTPVSETFNATADGGLYLNVLDLAHWDAALSKPGLLTKASMDAMWTPFRQADGKPNQANYGFGWFISSENGHREIVHGGDVSGFDCVIQRYPDDKITVVVMTNLDGTHAHSDMIAHVVAGFARPALMPLPVGPIPDSKPDIAKLAWSTLERLARNEDLSDIFAPEAGYVFDPADGADTLAQLPTGWRSAKLKLIHRSPDGLTSDYRLATPNDSRVVTVQTSAAGKLTGLFIYADRDRHR